MHFYDVAVEAPLFKTFTYSSELPVSPGQRVSVSFGKRSADGIVLKELSAPEDTTKIKSISSVHEDYPLQSTARLKWLRWISEYYVHPMGLVLQLCYPSLKKGGRPTKKAAIKMSEKLSQSVQLTEEQQKASDSILNLPEFHAHLLYGITGSGKTEVYLDVLEKKIEEGKKGLVLVPEISLTPQLIRRFSERFGDQIAVLHSQLTDREKTNQWWSIVEGDKKILIGARSALFCPIPNLGVIVVDEEHEASFKQEEKLKYHARDCAIMLAKELGIPICLGSATPSLESWKNASEGKYHLHRLTKRVTTENVANIHVIDMRENKKDEDSELPSWMSDYLYQKINETLMEKKQVALFLNRRGLSQIVMCRGCGHTYMCPNCDISLSLHAKTHLTCHYCAFHEDLGDYCKICKVGETKPVGIGTEKVETDIQTLFPNTRTLRMDRDEVNDRITLEDSIRKIENSEIDIIIGTQMIAKGLDFKNLTLVGILLADIGFNIPDFRTGERSFQLLTQVSGRAGRHSQGDVVIQTYNPTFSSLVFAQNKNYEAFAEYELTHRKELFYPPYGKLMSVRIQSLNYTKLKDYIALLEKAVSQYALGSSFQVLGPAPSPIFKIKNKYRYGMLVKAASSKQIREFYLRIQEKLPPPHGVQVLPDIDPLNTF